MATADEMRGTASRRAPIPEEPLRDQLFAACGYAFAVAALIIGLLATHVGAAGMVSGVVLGVLLVPVNLMALRRHAARRRRPAGAAAERGPEAGR